MKSVKKREKVGKRLTIAVNPINYGNPKYWPKTDKDTYLSYVEALADFVIWLVERGDKVLLFRTSYGDRIVLNDIWVSIKKKITSDKISEVIEVEASNYQDMLNEVVQADLVVASRLHAIILSQLLGIPTLAITWERKIEAQMEDFKQSRYVVDIDIVNQKNIRATFLELEKDADDIRQTLKQCVKSYRAEIYKQYDALLQIADNKN